MKKVSRKKVAWGHKKAAWDQRTALEYFEWVQSFLHCPKHFLWSMLLEKGEIDGGIHGKIMQLEEGEPRREQMLPIPSTWLAKDFQKRADVARQILFSLYKLTGASKAANG